MDNHLEEETHHDEVSPMMKKDEEEGGSIESTYGSTITGEADTNKDKPEDRLRKLAIDLSLYVNIFITIAKFVAYARTLSLSVLAALVDSILDVVSQLVLSYTEKHSTMHRSSAHYPAGASRLEPIGVLTCAALMGMASFEVVKESAEQLFFHDDKMAVAVAATSSFLSLVVIILVKVVLLVLCKKAGHRRTQQTTSNYLSSVMIDPTLDALAQDHFNDALSNGVAAFALVCVLSSPSLWFVDPIGAMLISAYIIVSWYWQGKEMIEQLTGKVAPNDFIQELYDIANHFDPRMQVDVVRAYHFGPKFLVELEVVLPKNTLLFESHDLGMELQYEIEGREEVERCFVHIDYESRPYDEHVISKVPELRQKFLKERSSSAYSV